MQNDPSTAWPTGVSATGDDFTNFLEFNDLDIDFQAFDGQVPTQPAPAQEVADQNELNTAAYYEQMHHASMQKTGSTSDLRARMNDMQVRGPSSHPVQHGYPRQMYSQATIPPTPSSTDLHGGASHLVVDAHHAAIYEAHMRKQQEQMAFTPLGTPAVTPMDAHFQMRDFAVPGEYFSPLASPALHAQSESAMYYPYQMSDVSETASPVDVAFDTSLKATVNRRPQKKRSPGSVSKPSPRTVKQSPAMKAQQKKKAASTVIPSKEIHDVLASSRPSTANGSQSLGLPATNLSSESPEPFLEMMPPPAIPSANRSPYVPAGSQSAPARGNAPATPTSLLKMNTEPMQDLSLGDAALDNEDIAMTDAPTPTISAIQNGGFTPLSSAMSPPSTAATPRMKGKADTKAPSKGKKRNSSSHPSPALRPKISPSIKPLLPEGMLNAETSALLLASKSNYQNILDGTHLPGVTYPDALSENLTSKRTSHKIAEQGRRNRINTALQEIAALLPQGANGIGDNSAAASQSNSKASTVEQAIDYIKALQSELLDTKERLAVSESRLKEMDSAKGSNSSVAATTPSVISDSGGDQTTATTLAATTTTTTTTE